MQQYRYSKKEEFVVVTIIGLQHRLDQFMYNLVHFSLYEVIVYYWILKLYGKGICKEDAIQVIYKARNLYLLR
ncbi:hypothetical protein U6A24_11160 [Aquimarina gracilis]|uniref:Uncharacterized protein n=1 Tax=Aquimarina gracilis TaxID=874422 RepID=A0ABU5ZVZ3_9FLAO|nr:hypothetical protein [Aquimarina gracilis]MEB3346024.1 hypothetical protein [Aquimarina gracilis]